tara:strand:+ start:413 stop:922 length:510 start_codon:yes stop_codon:yes gene_type:complete
MEFHNKPFSERKGAGETSEMYAMQYYKNRNINIIRSGLDALNEDIPVKNWMNIPKYIRNLPDFIIVGDKGNFFLECKGGFDHVHIKISELKSYGFWNDFIPVVMFVWSSAYKTIYRVEYVKLMDLITEQNYKIGEYGDNKEKYHIIPAGDLHLKGVMDKAPKLEKSGGN